MPSTLKALTLFLCTIPAQIFSASWSFKSTFETNTFYDTLTVTAAPGGSIASNYQTQSASLSGWSVYTLSPADETLAWTMVVPTNDTRLTAVKTGSTIKVTGRKKGKDYSKEFKTEKVPWIQEWQTGLSGQIRSGLKTFEFYSLDPGLENLSKFRVEWISNELLTQNQQSLAAARYRIRLDGILSGLMEGYFWYRADNGQFIRSEFKFFGSSSVFRRNVISFSEK